MGRKFPCTDPFRLDLVTDALNRWAIETADRFPNLLVKGIDLYPPPETWVAPNCVFEVDDVLKTWTHEHKYDLVHLRDMYGSFTDKQWTGVYKQAYECVTISTSMGATESNSV